MKLVMLKKLECKNRGMSKPSTLSRFFGPLRMNWKEKIKDFQRNMPSQVEQPLDLKFEKGKENSGFGETRDWKNLSQPWTIKIPKHDQNWNFLRQNSSKWRDFLIANLVEKIEAVILDKIQFDRRDLRNFTTLFEFSNYYIRIPTQEKVQKFLWKKSTENWEFSFQTLRQQEYKSLGIKNFELECRKGVNTKAVLWAF